jgi:hypothetical protein
MIKTILGYDIEAGVTPEEYEKWLFEVHAPDLLANPHLDRIVFNKVLRPVTQASGGSASVPEGYSFYRIAEMHFADEAAYTTYQQWFTSRPVPVERGPAGRTKFKFYVVTDSTEVTWETLSEKPTRPTT